MKPAPIGTGNEIIQCLLSLAQYPYRTKMLATIFILNGQNWEQKSTTIYVTKNLACHTGHGNLPDIINSTNKN